MARMRRDVIGLNRAVACALGVIWSSAGVAALFFGLTQSRWGLVVAGLLALGYALLWLRVAALKRLLMWSDLVHPWRAR